jgi:hypothetical protein
MQDLQDRMPPRPAGPMTDGTRGFAVTVLLLALLSGPLSQPARAADLQTVRVEQASARIPEGCRVRRGTTDVHECGWTSLEGSFETFGFFSVLVPAFSSMVGGTVERDLELALESALEQSSEGMGGRDDRVTRFSHSRLARSSLPRGAEACEYIRKSEASVDRNASGAARNIAYEKREMYCAVSAGREDVRVVAIVLAHSYRPGLGQALPPDFEARANRIFATLVIGR